MSSTSWFRELQRRPSTAVSPPGSPRARMRRLLPTSFGWWGRGHSWEAASGSSRTSPPVSPGPRLHGRPDDFTSLGKRFGGSDPQEFVDHRRVGARALCVLALPPWGDGRDSGCGDLLRGCRGGDADSGLHVADVHGWRLVAPDDDARPPGRRSTLSSCHRLLRPSDRGSHPCADSRHRVTDLGQTTARDSGVTAHVPWAAPRSRVERYLALRTVWWGCLVGDEGLGSGRTCRCDAERPGYALAVGSLTLGWLGVVQLAPHHADTQARAHPPPGCGVRDGCVDGWACRAAPHGFGPSARRARRLSDEGGDLVDEQPRGGRQGRIGAPGETDLARQVGAQRHEHCARQREDGVVGR